LPYYYICKNILMELSIIQIGNSKGLKLSKTLIEKYNIKDKVELILEKEYLVLKPITSPRKGWEEAFKEMNENGDDQLLFDDVFENESLVFKTPKALYTSSLFGIL